MRACDIFAIWCMKVTSLPERRAHTYTPRVMPESNAAIARAWYGRGVNPFGSVSSGIARLLGNTVRQRDRDRCAHRLLRKTACTGDVDLLLAHHRDDFHRERLVERPRNFDRQELREDHREAPSILRAAAPQLDEESLVAERVERVEQRVLDRGVGALRSAAAGLCLGGVAPARIASVVTETANRISHEHATRASAPVGEAR